MLRLDHLAVSASTLAQGVEWVENALGVALAPGGVHGLMSTHNQLLGLGDIYLEVIAINPAAPAPPHPRWFDLDNFAGAPRLTNWIVACDDLQAALAKLPTGVGQPTDLERGDLRWRMAIPADGRLPHGNAHPALIQWQGSAHPAQRLPDRGVRLDLLEIATPDAVALTTSLSGLFTDGRIRITHAAENTMRATFSTPRGLRVLE